MRHPYGERVTRLRPARTIDPYSQELTGFDWDAADELDIEGVAIEPRPSSEPVQDARNAVTSGFTLYAPPDADVLPGDRVLVRDVTYDVEGEPAHWRNPFNGSTPGVVIQTKAVNG